MSVYHYDLKHIKALRKVVLIQRLSVPEGFARTSSRRLQVIYNGVGPEAWGGKCRALITRALAILEAPALIHDYEYTRRDKSYWHFTRANLRLCLNTWRDAHFRAGVIAALLCQIFGFAGYREAGKGGWRARKNG